MTRSKTKRNKTSRRRTIGGTRLYQRCTLSISAMGSATDMMDVLETEKYPYAKFKGAITSSYNSDKSSKQKIRIKGEFTVHGARRILEIPGTMQFEGEHLKIMASWEQKLTDYDMEPPSVLFYSMKDKIEVHVKCMLSRK